MYKIYTALTISSLENFISDLMQRTSCIPTGGFTVIDKYPVKEISNPFDSNDRDELKKFLEVNKLTEVKVYAQAMYSTINTDE